MDLNHRPLPYQSLAQNGLYQATPNEAFGPRPGRVGSASSRADPVPHCLGHFGQLMWRDGTRFTAFVAEFPAARVQP
jgi:hypothetical protein